MEVERRFTNLVLPAARPHARTVTGRPASPRLRNGGPAAAAVLGLMLSLAPFEAHAQVSSGETGTEGWGKALGYIGCALSIVAASSTIGIAFAVVACGRVLITELGE